MYVFSLLSHLIRFGPKVFVEPILTMMGGQTAKNWGTQNAPGARVRNCRTPPLVIQV